MLPTVIDCYSIPSSSVKTSQMDLADFFILHPHKIAFCPSHQQHVFICTRSVPHAALDCLPNCSPVAHTPGVTHVPDTSSHLPEYQWGGTADTEVPRQGWCGGLLKEKPN